MEAALIEQEHRPTHIAYAWFNRKKWPDQDPRRTAAVKALLWRFLFSPSTLAIGGSIFGGIIGIATLWMLYHQNALLLEQNRLAQEQNSDFHNSLAPILDPKTHFSIKPIVHPNVEERGVSDSWCLIRVLVINLGDLPIAFHRGTIAIDRSGHKERGRFRLADPKWEGQAVVIASRSIETIDLEFEPPKILEMLRAKNVHECEAILEVTMIQANSEDYAIKQCGVTIFVDKSSQKVFVLDKESAQLFRKSGLISGHVKPM